MLPATLQSLIPAQVNGQHNEVEHLAETASAAEAGSLYAAAKQRLQQVNDWASYCGWLSSAFQLTDSAGRPLMRTAARGEFIRINMPGPGSSAGDGYDWVQIEKIEEQETPELRYYLMQVRPAAQPGKDAKPIAHFFDETATSSFLLVQQGTQVAMYILGRNEVPNQQALNTLDKLRNAVTGSTAAVGISQLQWKALAKGVLEAQH